MPFLRTARLAPGVLVLTSQLWQVNAVALRAGDTPVLVDSVVLPSELAALPGALRAAELEPQALVITHAHFDHVLGRAAYPDLPLLVGGRTAALLRRQPGQPLRELRDNDEELYVRRAELPDLQHGIQELPQHGEVRFGGAVLEVVPADGHAADGIALLEPEAGVLLPGDYLSEIEIPLVAKAGSPAGYLATLDRLEPLIERARHVVPGHGEPLDADQALRLLELDRRYLRALVDDPETARPLRGRGSARQQRIHEDNVRKHAGG